MKLLSLRIELMQAWQDNPGQYVATIQFEHEKTETKLVLTPEISNTLLASCAETITYCAKTTAERVASSIKQSLIEISRPQIELNSTETP